MDQIISALEAERSQIEEWFEHLHRHPELSMREENTARYIASVLQPWGFELATGVGKHGIVATLRAGEGDKAIGLRADFDALPIHEVNDLPYRSVTDGVAHLCGHDGHAATLLAAGKYLAAS